MRSSAAAEKSGEGMACKIRLKMFASATISLINFQNSNKMKNLLRAILSWKKRVLFTGDAGRRMFLSEEIRIKEDVWL
jgi:hypothetical protein